MLRRPGSFIANNACFQKCSRRSRRKTLFSFTQASRALAHKMMLKVTSMGLGRVWAWILFLVMGILSSIYMLQWWPSDQSGWTFQSATMQGRRFYQEDRLLTVSSVEGATRVGLFAVFDGHGGSQASEFAVTNFYHRFIDHLKNTSSSSAVGNLQDALRLAIADVEHGYMHLANKQGLIAGTTAVVAAVTSDSVVVGNVGDSRAFLCQVGGVDLGQRRVVPLTIDHHPNVPAERARIESMGGFVMNIGGYYRVNGNLAMSRAIGDKDLKPYGVSAEPEFRVWSRSKDEFVGGSCVLVVASDGVFERLRPEQVCKLVLDADKQNDEAVASRVLRAAHNSGSNDNLSLILVDLQ